MTDKTDDHGETDESGETDQWTNTVGDDEELDRLWSALIEATAPAEPKPPGTASPGTAPSGAGGIERSLAEHLGGLGARSRRTVEGLILAATAATATEGPGWEDWRVILHRHFIRDERMDLAVAAAILSELRRSGAKPNWHGASDRVLERVIASLIRDMRLELDAVDTEDQALAASAHLAILASELFDLAIALTEEQGEALRGAPVTARLLTEFQRQLDDRGTNDSKPVATNLVKARALLEVTIRQLELGGTVVH